MNILFVSREYPPETGGGGIGSYVATIGPALATLGHDVHVLSCERGQKRRDYVDHGVHIHRRDVLSVRGLGRLSWLTRTEPVLEVLLQGLSAHYEHARLAIDFDVIEYPDWGAEGWAFAVWHRKPLVAHLHTPIPVIWRYNGLPMTPTAYRAISALERFSIARADLITSPSEHLVAELKAMGWLANRDVAIVPHPIDWHRWCDVDPVTSTQPVVLFLAKLQTIKRPEVLIEAMRLIRRAVPDAQALFVGSYQPFVETGKSLDVDGCEFAGYVPRDQLIPYMSRARVLALPSWYENYPLAVLEAMASGRPVVVTTSTGIAEFVEQVRAGATVPADDARALAEQLQPFLTTTHLAQQKGENGRTAVREILDPGRMAERRAKMYEAAIASFKGKRARSTVRDGRNAIPGRVG